MSTALARPLYPTALNATLNQSVTFITPQSYRITPQSYRITLQSDGSVLGNASIAYDGPNCTGNVLVNTFNYPPGVVVSGGTNKPLGYVPLTGARVVTDPVRQSQDTGTACNTTPFNLTGTYYHAPANSAAVTGVGLTNGLPVTVTIEYVP